MKESVLGPALAVFVRDSTVTVQQPSRKITLKQSILLLTKQESSSTCFAVALNIVRLPVCGHVPNWVDSSVSPCFLS